MIKYHKCSLLLVLEHHKDLGVGNSLVKVIVILLNLVLNLMSTGFELVVHVGLLFSSVGGLSKHGVVLSLGCFLLWGKTHVLLVVLLNGEIVVFDSVLSVVGLGLSKRIFMLGVGVAGLSNIVLSLGIRIDSLMNIIHSLRSLIVVLRILMVTRTKKISEESQIHQSLVIFSIIEVTQDLWLVKVHQLHSLEVHEHRWWH